MSNPNYPVSSHSFNVGHHSKKVSLDKDMKEPGSFMSIQNMKDMNSPVLPSILEKNEEKMRDTLYDSNLTFKIGIKKQLEHKGIRLHPQLRHLRVKSHQNMVEIGSKNLSTSSLKRKQERAR